MFGFLGAIYPAFWRMDSMSFFKKSWNGRHEPGAFIYIGLWGMRITGFWGIISIFLHGYLGLGACTVWI